MSLENLGETYVDRGDVDQGLDQYRQADHSAPGAQRSSPGDQGYATDLSDAWVAIGNIQRQNGDPKGAGESYDQAGAVLDPLLKSHPNDSELQARLGRVLERQGKRAG